MKVSALVDIGRESARAAYAAGDAATDRLWDAISCAVVAYAAGDAFGVPYEFLPKKIAVDTTTIGVRPDWPSGGVSDDTLLSLLTIAAITSTGAQASADAFLAALTDAVPHLRGLGPTTRAALGLPVEEREAPLVGNTNGGMMRTAVVGLAFDPIDDDARRSLVHALAFATHKDPSATVCAVLASKLFSVASGAATAASPRDILLDEASFLDDVPSEITLMIAGLDGWVAPSDGIGLSPIETLAAVATIASQEHTCLDAYRVACEMGGDTDTVSALAAALVAAREPHTCGLFDIAWLDDVHWDEIPQASSAMARLFALRQISGEAYR